MMKSLFVRLGWADDTELDCKENALDERIEGRKKKRAKAIERATEASVEVLARRPREGTNDR